MSEVYSVSLVKAVPTAQKGNYDDTRKIQMSDGIIPSMVHAVKTTPDKVHHPPVLASPVRPIQRDVYESTQLIVGPSGLTTALQGESREQRWHQELPSLGSPTTWALAHLLRI